MKDKRARDLRAAHRQWFEENIQRKYVQVSPKNRSDGSAGCWAGNFNIDGRECFLVTLYPPRQNQADRDWRVFCAGNDDFDITREGLTREEAQRVYDQINDFTEIATLRSRGFRSL